MPGPAAGVVGASAEAGLDDAALGVVPGGAPAAPVAGTRVNKHSRLLVRGAGRADANGLYHARVVTLAGSQSGQLQFDKERGVKYTIVYAKKLLKKPACWCMMWKTNRLYQALASDPFEVPEQQWEVAGGVAAAALGSAPEVVDVSTCKGLLLELGPFWAIYRTLEGFLLEEGNHDALAAKPHLRQTSGTHHEKVYASADEGEDGEHFEVGSIAIVTQDEDFLRRELQEAGLPWNVVYRQMLGKSYKVVATAPPEVATVKESEALLIEVPTDALDLDYSHIEQFYNHHPIFISLQTTACALLWFFFASRDAGRNGTSWSEMMGGLESVWPGQTCLLLSQDCEDYRKQVWRWFSYQFSHVGLAHVATNVAVNLLLGVQLEKFHGTLKMALMYELGVFGGACCYMLVDGHLPVVGTSGGCFSLIGIRFGDLIMNWSQRPWRWAQLFFLTAVITINFVVEATSKPEGGASTSQAAHVGGGIAGLLAGVLLGRNLVRTRCELIFQACILCLAAALVAASFGVGMQWPPKNILEDEPWCWMRQVSNASLTGTWRWLCVRCSSESCIESWSQQLRMHVVSQESCEERGGFWFTEA